MSLTRNQLIIISGVFVFILVLILLFIFGGRQQGANQFSGTLTFWGVDEPSVFEPIFLEYKKIQPNLEIRYRKLNSDNYEDSLINGLASAQGPDLFIFPNTWLPKHYDKLQPIPESHLSISEFRRFFPTVVEQDFAPDGVIYALPLYVDTLAMFYNKDIFDSKGVPEPPKNWLEFQNLIPKLRDIDRSGKIIRAAAAIGGSERSINRASDVLNLLMLQAGSPMVAKDFSRADFTRDGLQSLKFYAQFADARNAAYTWNDAQPYSIDSFTEGNTSIIFNYSHQIKLLKDKNPLLRFEIAPMLQPESAKQNVNWANYNGLAVSAKTRNGEAAWHFINWLTTNSNASLKYLNAVRRPPALRSLISAFAGDPELEVFAGQVLSARSWPQINNAVVTDTFSEMISSIISGRATADRAILTAESKISQLMTGRR